MRTPASLFVALALFLSACLPAQDVADLASKAASNDAAERLAAFDALRALGAPGYEGLLELLVPAEQGTDGGARIALHGLAARLNSPAEPDAPRAAYCAALGRYLAGEAPTECKQFVIVQLGIAGKAECVSALAGLLANTDLATDAAEALTVNPSDEALAALRAALPELNGPGKLSAIQALGLRRDVPAVALLRAEAKSENPDVRVAALSAIGAIGHVEDFEALGVVGAALTAADAREQQAAFEAWLHLAEAFTALGEGDDRHLYVRALKAARSPQQRQAALLGLGKVGGRGDVTVIASYLTNAEPNVSRAAEDALASLPGEGAVTSIAEAVRAAEPVAKMALLSVLARRDEPDGRRAIEAAANDADVNVRTRALELLGRLADPAVRETLLEGVKAGNGVALTAYVKQADAVRDGGKPDEARPMYLTALDQARTDGLRSLALYGLAGVPSPELLPIVEPRLNETGTREAALRAYTAIASRFADEGDRERGKQMLLRALEFGPSREQTGDLVGKLRALGVDIDPARAGGFISTWSILGPFPGADVDAELAPEKGVDLAATVKAGDRELTWTPHQTNDPSGIVNLAALLDPHENSTAYLYAEVSVEPAQDILLKCGSDDGIKVWLNGTEIHRAPQPRSLRIDEDSVEAHLEAGVNKLLAKVVQGGGGWEACIRLTDRDGKPLRFTQP